MRFLTAMSSLKLAGAAMLAFASASTATTALTATAAAQDRPAGPFDASLPLREGTVEIAGLDAPVTIARDDLGVPVIEGKSKLDVYRGQGFVHAQERYFQMDLARRYAAGRLAELIGPPVVNMDRRMRPHRFQQVAEAVIERLTDEQRAELDAYVAGVNAGLEALGAAPPEYMLLRMTPEPWEATDSMLVVLSMFDQLHYNLVLEKRLAVMADALPEELYDLLTPLTTRFDAPLLPQFGEPDYMPATIPGPDVVNLSERNGEGVDTIEPDEVGAHPIEDDWLAARWREGAVGSNNWAVATEKSAHGGAIVANDPHLGLTAPGVWYRVQLEWPQWRIVGASLPGLPGVVLGSNGKIAWGVTNTTADFQDLIVIEVDADDPDRYRTPDGWEEFGEARETIDVANGEPVELTMRMTRWGPVHDTDHRGRPRVMKWVAREPAMLDLNLLSMMEMDELEGAVDLLRRSGGPSQNYVLADDEGRIAWVVSGHLPWRRGFDGSVPVSWAEPGVGWRGEFGPEQRPYIVNPFELILYTANNRTMGVETARMMGNLWAGAHRAARIEDLLTRQMTFDERDMLGVQLDNRVAVLDYHRGELLRVIPEDIADPVLALARRAVAGWNGTSDADQVGMAVLHRYRSTLQRKLVDPLVAPCRALDPSFNYLWFRDEEVLRRLLEVKAAHLLDPRYESYDELMRTAFEETVRSMAANRAEDQAALPTWGEVNLSRIEHPASSAVPAMFQGMLNMPSTPLSGYYDAIRVNVTSFGASCRMIVSPGKEALGIMQIPAGQSGHPWSPDYRSSHEAWLEGRPTPLLAGEPVAVLTLEPKVE